MDDDFDDLQLDEEEDVDNLLTNVPLQNSQIIDIRKESDTESDTESDSEDEKNSKKDDPEATQEEDLILDEESGDEDNEDTQVQYFKDPQIESPSPHSTPIRSIPPKKKTHTPSISKLELHDIRSSTIKRTRLTPFSNSINRKKKKKTTKILSGQEHADIHIARHSASILAQKEGAISLLETKSIDDLTFDKVVEKMPKMITEMNVNENEGDVEFELVVVKERVKTETTPSKQLFGSSITKKKFETPKSKSNLEKFELKKKELLKKKREDMELLEGDIMGPNESSKEVQLNEDEINNILSDLNMDEEDNVRKDLFPNEEDDNIFKKEVNLQTQYLNGSLHLPFESLPPEDDIITIENNIDEPSEIIDKEKERLKKLQEDQEIAERIKKRREREERRREREELNELIHRKIIEAEEQREEVLKKRKKKKVMKNIFNDMVEDEAVESDEEDLDADLYKNRRSVFDKDSDNDKISKKDLEEIVKSGFISFLPEEMLERDDVDSQEDMELQIADQEIIDSDDEDSDVDDDLYMKEQMEMRKKMKKKKKRRRRGLFDENMENYKLRKMRKFTIKDLEDWDIGVGTSMVKKALKKYYEEEKEQVEKVKQIRNLEELRRNEREKEEEEEERKEREYMRMILEKFEGPSKSNETTGDDDSEIERTPSGLNDNNVTQNEEETLIGKKRKRDDSEVEENNVNNSDEDQTTIEKEESDDDRVIGELKIFLPKAVITIPRRRKKKKMKFELTKNRKKILKKHRKSYKKRLQFTSTNQSTTKFGSGGFFKSSVKLPEAKSRKLE